MSYLHKMYGGRPSQPIERDKNPNRVLGGLKGAGVDTFTMLGEDGVEKRIPTEAYVKGLEEKVRQQDTRLAILEKQIRRLNNDQKVDRESISRAFNR
jgi:hypothetical protein